MLSVVLAVCCLNAPAEPPSGWIAYASRTGDHLVRTRVRTPDSVLDRWSINATPIYEIVIADDAGTVVYLDATEQDRAQASRPNENRYAFRNVLVRRERSTFALTSGSDGWCSLSVSPDGRVVAAIADTRSPRMVSGQTTESSLYVIPIGGGRPTRVATFTGEVPSQTMVLADGRAVAKSERHGWMAFGGGQSHMLFGADQRGNFPWWMPPSGDYVLAMIAGRIRRDGSSPAFLFEPTNGYRQNTIATEPSMVGSRSGRHAAFVLETATTRRSMFGVIRDGREVITRELDVRGRLAGVSDDGRWVMYVPSGESNLAVCALDMDTGESRPYYKATEAMGLVVWRELP